LLTASKVAAGRVGRDISVTPSVESNSSTEEAMAGPAADGVPAVVT
jgi:hypothetical protein